MKLFFFWAGFFIYFAAWVFAFDLTCWMLKFTQQRAFIKGVAAQTKVPRHKKSTFIHGRHHSSKYLSRYQLASSLFLQTAHASRVISHEDISCQCLQQKRFTGDLLCLFVFFPLTELCCSLKSEAPESDKGGGCGEGEENRMQKRRRQTFGGESLLDLFQFQYQHIKKLILCNYFIKLYLWASADPEQTTGAAGWYRHTDK